MVVLTDLVFLVMVDVCPDIVLEDLETIPSEAKKGLLESVGNSVSS